MALREFIFFGQDGKPLFVRNDAEQAGWQVDEYSLTCQFPFKEDCRIIQGMRIGFVDDSARFQPFEVRKVRNYEPDHYQEVTAEHICIAELTDYHTDEKELDNVTAQAALQTVLDAQPGTVTGSERWIIGQVSASNVSSGDIGLGSIWQNIRNIEQNWNVYIVPYITYSSDGITSRQLDIIPAEGSWRGVRLSLDKNAGEVGVTIDDSEVKTALYGYGGTKTEDESKPGDEDPDYQQEKITLEGYTWSDAPEGAVLKNGYIEDTAATAAYGRNGLARFGFYSNGDIKDQKTLAQKTWEVLQTTNKPQISIDCLVCDLYRMGYHDEVMRLHDTVMVELRPTGDIYTLEVVKLFIDLLDPTATRPTIGAYIPNIIYIQRDMGQAAAGPSGSISGRRGGQTEKEAEWSEFTAGIEYSNLVIALHAEQIDRNYNILKQAGMTLNADGVIIYSTDNANNIQSIINVQRDRITQEVTDRSNADTELSGKITVEKDRISQIVTAVGKDGQVTAASIVTAINAQTGTSSVSINADKVYIDSNQKVSINDALEITSGGALWVKRSAQFGSAGGQIVTINGGTVNAPTLQVNSGGALVFSPGTGSGTALSINHAKAAAVVDSISKNTNLPDGQFGFHFTTIGNATGSDINFNIADTAYYKSHVGIKTTGSWQWDAEENKYYRTIAPNDGQSETIYLPEVTASVGTFVNHQATVLFKGPGNHTIASATVDALTEYQQGRDDYSGIKTTGSWQWDAEENKYYRTISPKYGQAQEIYLPTITATAGSFVNHVSTVTVYGPNNHAITTCPIDATDEYTSGRSTGWGNAFGKVRYPTEEGTENYINIRVPAKTYNTSKYDINYYVSSETINGTLYAVIRYGSAGNIVARSSISVAQRTVSSLSKVTLYSSDAGKTVQKNTTVYYSDSTSGSATISVDATAISGGGSSLGTKNITENGTYNASLDGYDGYSSVTVNVQTSGVKGPVEAGWNTNGGTEDISQAGSANKIFVRNYDFIVRDGDGNTVASRPVHVTATLNSSGFGSIKIEKNYA